MYHLIDTEHRRVLMSGSLQEIRWFVLDQTGMVASDYAIKQIGKSVRLVQNANLEEPVGLQDPLEIHGIF